MNYAVINNNIVIAIVGIFPTNFYQFDTVIPTDKPVVVGDTYIDGNFYRNGERVLSAEELEIADMRDALAKLGVE